MSAGVFPVLCRVLCVHVAAACSTLRWHCRTACACSRGVGPSAQCAAVLADLLQLSYEAGHVGLGPTLAAIAHPLLLTRRLGHNQLTGGLPAGFAAAGSFTQLRVLSFAGNSGLGGTLPPEYGDAATALPSLQTLDVSGCGLTGALPAQWGPGLQSLQSM